MSSVSRQLMRLALVVTPALVIAGPAQAKPLKAEAKKFLAQHAQVNARFKPFEAQVLKMTAAKRAELKACPPVSALPQDHYEQIISELYVLLDMIQEAAALAHDDLVASAASYRAARYGDSVLKRAAAERARHLQTLSELKPFDSCQIIVDWAGASWPTDWKPKGEVWEAAKAIYIPDLQIPDSGPLKRRLRKLGASNAQLREIGDVAVNDRVLDGWDKVVRELFPLARDVDWR